ncbi:MAG: hypothetical protein GAK30_02976 [Paracidovorax wautersii]|uniref:Uncharacterized protein n=1 Tax=Paracidovorax wautersii TaxID=1177982 RepID=A0A7V8JPL6_9BURK|nr:MAG: hypothetical protein GAK30_02976 [Paracidovorax wautersii]
MIDFIDRKLLERGFPSYWHLKQDDYPPSALDACEGFSNQPAPAGFFTPEGDRDAPPL